MTPGESHRKRKRSAIFVVVFKKSMFTLLPKRKLCIICYIIATTIPRLLHHYASAKKLCFLKNIIHSDKIFALLALKQ